MPRLPDFVIIGAMKCATSTLHEQLALQKGFHMSEPKEPNFFSDDDVWARGLEWYGELFAGAAPGSLCGESSTHYTKRLTHPRTLERLRGVLGPEVRYVYVMRHPIERLVSHYIHEWSMGVIDGDIDAALDSHPELLDHGRYAHQLEPWLAEFGPERVLPVFFARIRAHPQAVLERVCTFLGHAGPVRWDPDLGRQNVSSERMRPSPLRDFVKDLPGATWLRRSLLPRGLRERIKDRWRMQQRPALSARALARVTDVFDADLALLGRSLGLELNCANFNAATRDVEPAWAARLPAERAG